MTWVKIVLIIAAVSLYASVALLLLKKEKLNLIGKILAGVGIGCNVLIVLYNWILNGYVPFISMYQVLAFLGICFPLSYLYVVKLRKAQISFAWFMLCSGICMTGCVFMDATSIWHRVPALQSPFFIPHILMYMISYSLCAVGFVQTIVMMIQKDPKKKKAEEKTAYTITITGFPFMVIGMFLGALWANECWGTYWAWDPKETWALITTCLYALYFHCRKHKALKKFCAVILILAFASLLMTFIGVNMFGLDAQHSYT